MGESQEKGAGAGNVMYKRWEIWVPCPPVPLPVTVTVYEKPSDTLTLVYGMSHCNNLYLIFFY